MNHQSAFPILISCGAAKMGEACAARELYTGSYFKALLAWAESVQAPEQICVLSALHGVVPLDQVLEPYNARVPTNVKFPQRLRSLVADQLRGRFGPLQRVYFAGGGDYWRWLDLSWGFAQAVFPPGLGIGKQLQ